MLYVNRLFTLSSLDQGGIETYLLRFLKSNLGKSQCNFVFCKSGVFGNLKSEYEKLGVNLFAIKLGYFNLFNYVKFYRFIRKNKFSTVVDFTGNFAGFPLLFAKIAGVPTRIAMYRGAEDHFTHTLLRDIYNNGVKILTRFCSTKILSNSAAAFDYFFPKIWQKNSKFKVIYNGIDCEKLLAARTEKCVIRNEFGIPHDAFVVGHTGRYAPAKNHDTIIEVAINLCKRFPKIYFVIVGLGVDEAYANRIKQESLEKQIILTGYRPDVPRILYLFDLFYFPSLTEGQPNSLIEAEVVGLPILASNINPIKEAVPENIFPKLVPPKDIPRAVSTIEKLYRNPELRKEYVCDKWAKEKFNGKLRFEEFRNEIEK